jgi:peptidoglycan/LPS O-acetylase OafA/YrhL
VSSTAKATTATPDDGVAIADAPHTSTNELPGTGEPAGRVAEPAGRVAEPAGRVAEPAGTPAGEAAATTTARAGQAVPAGREQLPAGRRLGFLDVLRGIAAMGVVLYHLGNQKEIGTSGYYWATHSLLNLGAFGVLTFFLVSGFIIPASLERHGSIAEFWISRVFRLGPLFWVVSLGVLALGLAGLMPIPPTTTTKPLNVFFGNVTIMARHVGQPFLIGPAWTLPYEICFYLLATVIFVTRLRRNSAWIALIAGGCTLLAANWVVGPNAITWWAQRIPGYHGDRLKVLVLGLALAVAAVLLVRSRRLALYAAPVALLFVPLLLNRPDPLHQAAIYLATMLTGTVLHRIWSGDISPRIGWPVLAVCAAASAGSFLLYSKTWYGVAAGVRQVGESGWTRAIALITAYALVTVFFLLRNRVNWPAGMQWLGRVSYSLYLTHWVILQAVPPLPASVPGYRLLSMLIWLVAALVTSELTYRFVEKPGIDAGRWVARRLRERGVIKRQLAEA